MAIKEWELPLKAHLRGAIALINEKRAKKLPDPQSSTIYNAVESQIVSVFALVLETIHQALIYQVLDQNYQRT